MGLYRDENGQVFEMDDGAAARLGLEPATIQEQGGAARAAAGEMAADERGAIGTLNAALTGAASTLTAGGTDVLLSEMLTGNERDRLNTDIEDHEIARLGGEIGGAVLGGFAAPSSLAGKLPGSYLSTLSGQAAERALVEGGKKNLGKAIATMGAEGAAQNAGQYIGRAALADKDTSIEGLAGAMGDGFVFGSGGGAAALGISKGAMSAKKLFSKLMDGGTDGVRGAQTAFQNQLDNVLSADAETAIAAQKKLEDIRLAKRAAQIEKAANDASVKDELALAANAEKWQPPITLPDSPLLAKPPADVPVVATGPDGTRVIPRGTVADDVAGVADDVADEASGLEGLIAAQRRAGQATEVVSPTTKVLPRGAAVADETTDLERALQEMAASKNPLAAAVDEPSGLEGLIAAQKRAGQATDVVTSDATAVAKRPAKAAASADSTAVAKPKAAEMPFHDEVTSFANNAKAGVFGDEKVFISQVFEDMKKAGRFDGTLDDFKKALDRERMAGNLPLARADYVGAMDPKMVAASSMLDDQAHFVMRGKVKTPVPSAKAIHENHNVLGKQIAQEETELEAALAEFEGAKNRLLDDLADDFAEKESAVDRMLAMDDRFAPKKPEVMTSVGRKKAVEEIQEKLETVHAQIDEATDDLTAASLAGEADDLEEQLLRMGSGNEFVDDVARKTKSFAEYEKAQKRLVEATGDLAHPGSVEAVQASAAAEKEAESALFDRMTRAAEDAEMHGPPERWGPARMKPQDRVKYARARKAEADASFANLKTQELQAETAFDAVKGNLPKETKGAAPAVAGKVGGKGGKVADGLGLYELADLPGMPKPSDLPVVGPILGAWLKYRGIKAAMGKFAGKIPATADARAAALAARTKERVAKAIDRGFAGIAKGAKAARKVAPLTPLITKRIFDDGQPDADAKAPIGEHVAVRLRELSAYLARPGALERDVRKQMRDVSDPALIAGMEKFRRNALQWVLDQSPALPMQHPLAKNKTTLSPGEATAFARRWQAVHDPASIFEAIAHEQDMLTLESAQTLRKVYPSLFALGQQYMLKRAQELQNPVPYAARVKMSLLYDVPLDSTLEPDNFKILQSVYQKPAPAMPAAAPGAPPTPGIAAPTNLTAIYGDRPMR